MSAVAERGGPPALPPSWNRLEQAAEEAAVALSLWRHRALEAEEEVARLRHALEAVATQQDRPLDVEEEVRRLRAENTALRSRMAQARKRIGALLSRMGTLESES